MDWSDWDCENVNDEDKEMNEDVKNIKISLLTYIIAAWLEDF